ncbi:MAG: hypothetical protein ACTS41_00510 [Candidatus Hodgkinia cicadicola]
MIWTIPLTLPPFFRFTSVITFIGLLLFHRRRNRAKSSYILLTSNLRFVKLISFEYFNLPNLFRFSFVNRFA